MDCDRTQNQYFTILLVRSCKTVHYYTTTTTTTTTTIAIEFSLGGSSSYTCTDKTNKNKYAYTKQYKNTVQTIQNTVYTNTHITKTPAQLSKHPHTHSPTHYKGN